jgi:hypothetical protein
MKFFIVCETNPSPLHIALLVVASQKPFRCCKYENWLFRGYKKEKHKSKIASHPKLHASEQYDLVPASITMLKVMT